jgi:hypothetical protein
LADGPFDLTAHLMRIAPPDLPYDLSSQSALSAPISIINGCNIGKPKKPSQISPTDALHPVLI